VITLIVVLVMVFGLMLFMWISVGREPGPSAADVAIAYERAWDDLDFTLLYDLSGPELRDGMNRERFVSAKRAAYAKTAGAHRIGAAVSVDDSVVGNQTALVVTKVEANGSSVRNNVMLEKRSNGWVVVGYSLRPDDAEAPRRSS
jgi:hypothetical protein